MPMGIVVISCVRPSVQPSMGLGLCIAYKALGRNGLQFGMLMYPDGLHSAFNTLVDTGDICCHYWQHILVYITMLWIVTREKWLYVCHICMCVDLYVCVRYSDCITMCGIINSLWPGDAIWRHISGSTSAQVMACCLAAPSHYLNQCWLIIIEVLWHSP